MICSAHVYGWLTTTINYLLDPKSPEPMTESQVSWIISITSVGELLGGLTAGVLSDKWGRKICILLTGPIFVFTWVIVIFTKSYVVLLVIRVLQGIAGATAYTVTPVYLGEIASPSIRGRITGLLPIFYFVGNFIEYCLNALFSHTQLTVFNAAVPLLFTILFAFQPESPYYLVFKGKESEAAATLEYLRINHSQDDILCELEEIKNSVAEDIENTYSWKDVVATDTDRRALLILILVGVIQVYSGFLTLTSYATHLFVLSRTNFMSPDIFTIILGLAMLLGGLVNSCIVDSFGRRPLLFISCFGSFFSLLIVGISFYLNLRTTIDISFYSWAVPLGVIMYCIFMVIGIIPIILTYTFELFTTKTRGKAASISTINITVGSFVCVNLYQTIIDYCGFFAVFWYFAFICLTGGILLFYFAPETKGKSLIQIRAEMLNVRNRKHKISQKNINKYKEEELESL